MKSRWWRWRIVALAASAVVALAALAGLGYATIPNGDMINACYVRSGGTLRVIDASVTSCKSSETALVWNVQGAQGPPGPVGPAGPAGPQGPQGPAGVSGWQLVSVAVPDVDAGELATFGEFSNPVVCAPGKKVLGGGVTPSFSSGTGPRLLYSGPSADGTRWDARLENTTAIDDMVVTGWAICAAVS